MIDIEMSAKGIFDRLKEILVSSQSEPEQIDILYMIEQKINYFKYNFGEEPRVIILGRFEIAQLENQLVANRQMKPENKGKHKYSKRYYGVLFGINVKASLADYVLEVA